MTHPAVSSALSLITHTDGAIPPIPKGKYPYRLTSFAAALRRGLGPMYSVHIVGKAIYVKKWS
jgi:hypothetical protein